MHPWLFPMTENYPLFKTYLLPILLELHSDVVGSGRDSLALEGTHHA